MRSTIIVASAFLAAAALAQPHQHHKHHVEKRTVVWETEIEVVTETIPITTTIWVEEGQVPATTSATKTDARFYETSHKLERTTSIAPVVVPAPTPTPTPSPTTLSTSTSAAAVIPVASTPAVPVVVVPSTTPSAYVAPPTSTYVAPVESSPASSGYSGQCAAGGAPCSGDMTHYVAGLGACGDVSDGDKSRVVALPFGLMGTASSGLIKNPYCGMTITVKLGTKSTTATVVDKCMGCVGESIDMSNLAFSDLADMGIGRTQVTWHFN
jgi:hypothetical protein